jgi:hypothetical protein
MARTCKKLAVVLAIAGTISVAAGIASAQTDVYKVNYFSNNLSGAPDATLRIDNPGLTYGNLCAMVYVFASDQQLAECCGCIETPDGLETFSVQKNLTSNPLTGKVPIDGVVKIVSAKPVGSVCDPTASYTPVPNLRAWVTHIEDPVGIAYPITETESSNSALGASELAGLQTQCAFVKTLGSGNGICTCGTEALVPPPLCSSEVSASVTPDPLTLDAGQMQQLGATATFSDGSTPIVAWSSSNTSIATVSSSGLVTAVATGSATIYATISSSTSCASTKVPDPITVSAITPPHTASCSTAGSLGTLLQGNSVTAYVPNGSWTSLNTGVLVVPIEPTPLASPSSIATPGAVNSCAANSNTGEAVCTANNTDVYLISGSILNKTLTSGATGLSTFSGGQCENCGVTINPATNTALISIGVSSTPSQSGLQFLNLATNTFSAPVPAVNELTEDVVWDPGRNLILSPDEQGTYDLFDTSKTPPVEYANVVSGAPNFDSAGEDCETGIALASDEYTSNLFITDLTQAKFKAGSPTGTWTAPSALVDITDFAPYAGSESGTTGIAVAQGTHLGIVTGEFPDPPDTGNAIIVIQLPSTSGTGTPAFVDWAVVVLPNDPIGSVFSMGCDPHTVTAYVSPNSGKAIGVVTDYSYTSCKSSGSPQYLGLIDLAGVLKAPRTPGTHTVSPSYNLTGSGVVKFVPAQ